MSRKRKLQDRTAAAEPDNDRCTTAAEPDAAPEAQLENYVVDDDEQTLMNQMLGFSSFDSTKREQPQPQPYEGPLDHKPVFNTKGQICCPYNPELAKFWWRRYEFFSNWGTGVALDAESWFSITPEAIANGQVLQLTTAPRL